MKRVDQCSFYADNILKFLKSCLKMIPGILYNACGVGVFSHELHELHELHPARLVVHVGNYHELPLFIFAFMAENLSQ